MSQRDERYKKNQRHKKRTSGSNTTGTRSTSGVKGHAGNKSSTAKKSNGKQSGRKHGKQARKNRISRSVGMVLAVVQLLASIVFMVEMKILNMLPMKYYALLGAILFLLFAIVLVTQYYSKKKSIAGKVISVILTIVMLVGSYYISRTSSALDEVTGGDYKLDKVVVAVMADDKAEEIKDAKEYTFGVQYKMNGSQIEETMDAINKETGTTVKTVEYDSLAEQAQALHDGKVDAIVYNEGYTGILEEAFENYSQNTKVIYSYSIKSKVENKSKDVSVDKCFSVYISGIDVYGAIETNSRSDVNIIAEVNPETHQILLITTPRDYYVEIPGISGGQKDKLTHAGIYGVDASMATLEQLYDTELDFYARVNFTSLIDIVDALGGVDVDSELAFTTSEDSGLVMDVVQGTNHFNGKQALAFSRERQNIDGGDNQRGKNQQAVITAMIKKMVSPAILTGANGIISSVSGNVDTNMSTSQIQDLIKTQLADGATWNIKSMAAEGTGDNQMCYSYSGSTLYVMQPNQESVDAIKTAIKDLESGKTLDGSVSTQ